MGWKELVDQRRIVPETTTPQEIDNYQELAKRAFADAMLDAPLSDDGRFERAYDAARALATVVVRSSGYRVRGSGGNHYTTFLALEIADATRFAPFAAYFNVCREKRNQVSYVAPGTVTRTEVEEILRVVPKFRDAVDRWLHDRHPELAE
jgi:hypothetical protein